jgi:hypothetical protein
MNIFIITSTWKFNKNIRVMLSRKRRTLHLIGFVYICCFIVDKTRSHNTKNMSQHQTRVTTPKTCHNTKQDHTTPNKITQHQKHVTTQNKITQHQKHVTTPNKITQHTTHNTKNMSQFIYFTFSFVCFFCISSVNIFKVKLAVSFCYLSVISDICEPCLEGGGFNIPYT